MYNKFKGLLKIDKNALDEMCIKQPVLYADVAEFVAEAKQTYDTAKIENERAKYALGLQIRLQNVTKKITEAAIAERIGVDEDYVASKKTLCETKRQFELWSGLLQAYSERSNMLGLLCKLAQNEYYQIKASTISTVGYEETKKVIQENKTGRRRRMT